MNIFVTILTQFIFYFKVYLIDHPGFVGFFMTGTAFCRLMLTFEPESRRTMVKVNLSPALHRMAVYTIIRLVLFLFLPDILQSGALMGVMMTKHAAFIRKVIPLGMIKCFLVAHHARDSQMRLLQGKPSLVMFLNGEICRCKSFNSMTVLTGALLWPVNKLTPMIILMAIAAKFKFQILNGASLLMAFGTRH